MAAKACPTFARADRSNPSRVHQSPYIYTQTELTTAVEDPTNIPEETNERDTAETGGEQLRGGDTEQETEDSSTEDGSTEDDVVDPNTKYCQECGSTINQKAVICPECGVEQHSSSSGGDDAGVAVLLSAVGFFIPLFAGAGQLYNGEIGKGVALTVIQIINVFLAFVIIGLLTYPIVAAYSMYDAYHGAE